MTGQFEQITKDEAREWYLTRRFFYIREHMCRGMKIVDTAFYSLGYRDVDVHSYWAHHIKKKYL